MINVVTYVNKLSLERSTTQQSKTSSSTSYATFTRTYIIAAIFQDQVDTLLGCLCFLLQCITTHTLLVIAHVRLIPIFFFGVDRDIDDLGVQTTFEQLT